MRKLLLLPLMLGMQSIHAGNSLDYHAIKKHIGHGHQVRIVIDFAKCQVAGKLNDSRISFVGAYTPNEIIIRQNGHIDASFRHFTLNSGYDPGRAVYQYVNYSITPDNHVNVKTQVMDALSYKPISEVSSYDCELGTSAGVYHNN